MSVSSKFAPALVAFGLVLGVASGALAAESHSHDGHGAATLELKLNAGAKWQGDAAMRESMADIRAAIAARLGEIHENRLPAGQYKALASTVQGEIDYMVENCKLPIEVDEQLHVVLGQVIDGIGEMEDGENPRAGAVLIVKALNAYGEHFEHPGWQPLGK
jgi:hypothetical protein